MMKRSILIIGNGNELCSELVDHLSCYGDEFGVLREGTGRAGIRAVRTNAIDLLVMDAGLSDMDGREAVKILRRSGYKAPIIIVSAQDTDADTILAFEAGADDYVPEPFHFPVLLARIRAQLRQYEQREDATFSMGPFTFKPGKKLLLDESGRKIRLTATETAIIRSLYSADRGVVRREVLLQAVWGHDPPVTSHTLETHIYRLRQKIARDPSDAAFLVTEDGGYRLSF
ncbi:MULTISPECIES: response regulator transcription factor [unclassified Ensifer]|uniref:response regulator transcription factor n=1 Tax=unclassified Ensifer TaxID=2633371 RepID=UPI000813B513|nr:MULTISPECIES: response regulator transcription factor [unclassified Ensifer]OCP19377.1 DNA-binding response regulator [Ensifer sp. LC54]OCP19497.1 DNA-binding response regulator [Ensifer sp. LC384]